MDQNIKPEQRKPLSMSSNVNQVYHRQNKRSITNETLKAAEEILAVLQDSPVKINKKDVGTDQHNLKAKEVRKVDNKNKSEEFKKLDDAVIAGLLFDSDDENNCGASVNGTEKITYIKHSSPKKSKKFDNKNESKTNKSVNSPGNKVYFDEEDVLVNLSDFDDSLNDSKTDKVGEWIITKSPRNKIQSPQRNQTVNNHSKNGLVTGNKARRSLVLQLDSVKVNGSTNSPLRLKLKRKATSEIDEDEPNCKERRKETIGQDASKNEDHASKGLRSREKLKLPKWRQESSECGWSPLKTGKINSSPSTPKTNKKKISLSKNTTPNVSKLSSSISSPLKDSSPLKSSNLSESNSVKDKTSPELIKSAAEIYDILHTPEKGIDEKVNGSSDAKLNKVASVRLFKYEDRHTPLLKSKNAKSLNSNCSPHTPQSKKKNHISNFESPAGNKSINKHAAETPSPRRSKRTRIVDIDTDSCSAPSSPVPSAKNIGSASKTESSLTKIRNQSTPNNKIKEFNHVPLRSSEKKPKKQTTDEKISDNDITTLRTIASPKKSSKASEKSLITRNYSLSVGLNTSSSLDEARTQLLASTVPQSLPCRDKEFNNIYGFILRKIDDLAGGCMYISGVPGTGKTATVHAVIRKLQLEAKEDDDVPDFDFVEINGLRLTEPRQAYTRMWQTLSGQRLTPEQAQRCLDRRFSFNAKKPTVLLVDELDYLCNRRQDVVYNILDWPTKQGSALVVLTIANTMDLPERTLKGKITSRMGLTRLMFQPYTHHQLQEIVLNRLSGNNRFHPDAVQLVARKVAAVSGDARRALDICRRSTELVDSSGIVTIQTVEKALSQIFMGPRIRAIRSCSTMAQLVMRALRDETLRTGVDESNIGKVYQHLKNICALEGIENPTTGDVLSISTTLENLGLVVAEKGRPDLVRKLSLNVSSDDIHYALNC